MSELDDHQLLAEFARRRSEIAFTELVRRHAGLVYSAALRFCSNPQHAEEITQAVFIILARKAGTLPSRVMVSGWLYQAARLTAANFVKGEIRRRRREQEACMQSTLNEPDAAAWETIAPLLDEAMGVLGETDRNVVLLRYFENCTSREIGAALRMNEETARKRVNRALEKLRHFFVKRGVPVSGAALSGAISAHSIQPVPAVMVKSICAVALAKGAAASTSTLTLIKGALKIMAWTRTKTVIVASAAVLFATSATVVVVEKAISPSVDESLWEMKPENLKKAPPVVIIRPTRFSDSSCIRDSNGRIIARNYDFQGLLGVAYETLNPGGIRFLFGRERIILPADAPQGGYDLMFTVPNHPVKILQESISRKTGFVARKEIRETEVLLLRVKDPRLFAPYVSKPGSERGIKDSNTLVTFSNYPMSFVADYLESGFHKPVIVQPGLSGNYDITFQWEDDEGMEQALSNELAQAGLELLPTNMPIEMLVVEKAK